MSGWIGLALGVIAVRWWWPLVVGTVESAITLPIICDWRVAIGVRCDAQFLVGQAALRVAAAALCYWLGYGLRLGILYILYKIRPKLRPLPPPPPVRLTDRPPVDQMAQPSKTPVAIVMGKVFATAYYLAVLATFGKLTFFDGYVYTWWNWLIAVPINIFLAHIWPIYWLILKPLFG